VTRRGAALALVGALAALVVVGAVGPYRADGRGLKTGLLDVLFTSPDPTVRARWLDEAAGVRSEIVRINLGWAFTVGPSRPSDPTDPADPAYDFSEIDAAVRDADARGLEVLLSPILAPEWAEGGNRPQHVDAGVWRPNPADLGDYAQALATRYSGAFANLPRVRLFQAWTEPNLGFFLSPQWHGDGSPASPSHYRLMLNAFYRGVKRAQPHARVISAGTSPYGEPPRGGRMRPVAFLRELFCLNRRLKPTKCPAIPRLDVLAHHPITTSGGPRRSAIHRDDAAMPDFRRIRRVLRAAERAGRVLPRGRHPMWATEFFWNTNPPSILGVPPPTQARWIAEAFYLLWKQGVRVAINIPIRDDPYDPGNPYLSVQSGLFFLNGEPKPSARSFRFPFVTERRSPRRIVAWGKAPREGLVRIQVKRRQGWRSLARLRVEVGEVFHRRLRLRGSRQLRASIGDERSRVWRQRR
jgi:hypothetical protein